MQNMQELADAKAENDALRDDVAAGRRQLHIKAICQSVHIDHHRLRRGYFVTFWRNTAERDYFTLRERGWSLCKNNWKEPRSILMSELQDRVAHIDGQLMQLLWAIRASSQM